MTSNPLSSLASFSDAPLFRIGQELPRLQGAPPGPRSLHLGKQATLAECPAFDARRMARSSESGVEQAPIVYAEGLGSNVLDADGNRYVDMVAGFGALALGHRPEPLASALAAQMDRLWLALGDVYGSEPKAALLERLAAFHPEPGARVLLGQTGADAITAAMKTSRLRTGRPGIVAFAGAYHGLSYGPLAACGYSEGFRQPFEDQLGVPVQFLPYPERPEGRDKLRSGLREALADPRMGAVLVEPLVGRGGCLVPYPGFLSDVREVCTQMGALLIVDEIWTGLGRTGDWLASTSEGIVPDLICVGKALGGGLPISACIGTAESMEPWGRHGGSTLHTATHFGNPLACVAALATLDGLATPGFFAHVVQLGVAFRDHLAHRCRSGGIVEVRGRGLMVGVELEGSAGRTQAVLRALLSKGYLALAGGRGGTVLTLTPPLTVAPSLLEAFSEALAASLSAIPR